MNMTKGTKFTIREKFDRQDSLRSDTLDRAYILANKTIPKLFLDRTFHGQASTKRLPELYSSKPAQAIKKLAATFANTLFPADDRPFFELKFGPRVPQEEREAMEDIIALAEMHTLDAIQSSNYRDKLYSSLEHAIVLPGSLMFQEKVGEFKLYHPNQFIIRRDGDGNIKEYWTVDWVVTSLLDDELKSMNNGMPKHATGEHEPLYSYARLVDGVWTVDREFRDKIYEEEKTFEELPYYFLGWTPIVGEDWSRSLCEDAWPTIRSLEEATKALVEGLTAGSSGRINVDAASSTTVDDLGSKNWGIISVAKGSVETIQPDTSRGLQWALASVQKFEQDIDNIFLTHSASDLRGERVTAFQTNVVSRETQQARGGVLVSMEQNLQAVVRRTITLLAKEGNMDPRLVQAIKDGDLVISVASGLDAISRQMDVLRMDQLLERVQSDPEMREWVKMGNVTQSYVRDLGLDPTKFSMTDDEYADAQQAKADAANRQKANETSIETAGAVAQNALTA